MISINLKGKSALVTGGSRGIGAGISKVLAKAGASVVLVHTKKEESFETARRLIKEIAKEGGNAWDVGANVEESQEMQKVAEEIEKKWRGLDILVNSAGTTSVVPFPSLPLEEWERIIKINLTGAYNSVKAVLPLMLKKKKGKIILIGSAAIVKGGGGGAHYAASKSALEGFTRALSRELAPRGINTNLVHPSLIETDLLHSRYPNSKEREKLVKEVPVGRLGKPEDIAYLVAFLSSDLADYICGQSFFVDGGRTFAG